MMPAPIRYDNAPVSLPWGEVPGYAQKALEGAVTRLLGVSTMSPREVANQLTLGRLRIYQHGEGYRVIGMRERMFVVLVDAMPTEQVFYVAAPFWRPLQSAEHVRALRRTSRLPPRGTSRGGFRRPYPGKPTSSHPGYGNRNR